MHHMPPVISDDGQLVPVLSREWGWGQQQQQQQRQHQHQHRLQHQRSLCSKKSSQDDGADKAENDVADKNDKHSGEQENGKDEGAEAAEKTESESNGANVKEMLLKEALGYVVRFVGLKCGSEPLLGK